MTRTRVGSLALIVGSAALFGVIDATFWSSRDDVLFWVGNVSSTYLLLAFVAGRIWFGTHRRLAPSAAAGLGATLIALAAFYGWAVATGNLYSGSALAVIWKYIAGGLITGPAFGLLGAFQARSRSWIPAAPLAAAFALEPVAWLAHGAARSMPALIIMVEFAAALAVLWGFRRQPGSDQQGRIAR